MVNFKYATIMVNKPGLDSTLVTVKFSKLRLSVAITSRPESITTMTGLFLLLAGLFFPDAPLLKITGDL